MAGEDVVKSAGRVFAVLELFDRERRSLSAAEVGAFLGYPQSSTLALLKSIMALGYLSYDIIDRVYAPTLRLSLLGDWIGRIPMDIDLTDLIEEIADATGESVSVTCQNELQMQFLSLHVGRNPLTLNIKPGTRAPLFQSNIGRVALSQRSDEQIARLAERINRKSAALGETVDLGSAMAAIEMIRRAGYGIGYGSYIPSIGAISWPMPTDGRTGQLVVSVAGPIESIRHAERSIIAKVTDILNSHPLAREGANA